MPVDCRPAREALRDRPRGSSPRAVARSSTRPATRARVARPAEHLARHRARAPPAAPRAARRPRAARASERALARTAAAPVLERARRRAAPRAGAPRPPRRRSNRLRDRARAHDPRAHPRARLCAGPGPGAASRCPVPSAARRASGACRPYARRRQAPCRRPKMPERRKMPEPSRDVRERGRAARGDHPPPGLQRGRPARDAGAGRGGPRADRVLRPASSTPSARASRSWGSTSS